MRSKLIAAAVSLVALAVPATAMAGGNAGAGSTGQAQINQQQAWIAQLAASKAKGDQNATNANAPTNVAGGDVNGGANSANQTATNGAQSGAGNLADTHQSNTQTQTDPSSGQSLGSGGSGQAQINDQQAWTAQLAASKAKGDQNATNANAPINVGGGDVDGRRQQRQPDRQERRASGAGNLADTHQSNTQTQTDPSSGADRVRRLRPGSDQRPEGVAPHSWPHAEAKGDQNAINANVPVNVAGGDVSGGANSANQTATNGALSGAGNDAAPTRATPRRSQPAARAARSGAVAQDRPSCRTRRRDPPGRAVGRER